MKKVLLSVSLLAALALIPSLANAQEDKGSKKKKGKKVRSSNVAPATSPEHTEDEERILVEIPVKRKPRG